MTIPVLYQTLFTCFKAEHHEMIRKMKKKGIRKLIGSIIKSILFSGITITALFFIESSENNTLFTKETQPVWFWGVFVILLILPIWLFRLYRYALNPSFYGEVVEIKDSKTANVNVAVGYGNRVSEVVDTCIVIVKSKAGLTQRFYFQRESASFARKFYRVGDRVYHYVFSDIPVNLSSESETKYCPCCGNLGADFEEECSACRVPFIEKQP